MSMKLLSPSQDFSSQAAEKVQTLENLQQEIDCPRCSDIASASDFRISYSHTCDPTIADCEGGGSILGSESGEELLLIQGTYQVEGNPAGNPADYTPTYSGDCSGRIEAGVAKTCTVTNTYTEP